jgi:hypothetical protein
MKLALRFRSAVLLAASAAAGPALAQGFPGGAYPAPGIPAEILSATGSGPYFSGGAQTLPVSAPITVAYGNQPISGGSVLSGPTISGPMPPGTILSDGTVGGPVYMSPQIVGGTPGMPGCDCGPGGMPLGGMPMGGGFPMGDPMMGGVYGSPGMATPMMGPELGGAPMYGPGYGSYGSGCCLESLFCCAPLCDPCPPAYGACPPVYDPCQPVGPPMGGVHGLGGQRCGWGAGFSFVFLKPHYGSNDAFYVTTASGGSAVTTNRDFSHSLDLSPRVFVEYVWPTDTGLRVTWFGFDHDADSITARSPEGGFLVTPFGQVAMPGESLHASSSFDIDTIDVDLTQRFQVQRSLINLGGGLRWAEYVHDYRADIANGAAARQATSASRRFSGAGPTVFAEWRRPIGMSPFSLLANVRGSVLYGRSTSNVVAETPTSFAAFRSRTDDFVAIGETQLGGEWSTWISRRSVFYVQVAWETQYWLGVGTALDRNDDLGLYGFSTTLGLEW